MRYPMLLLLALFFSQLLTAQVPVITSFSPSGTSPGAAVTISGSNFSTVATDNKVFFGAVRASVTAASATSLTVTVPTGAGYQPVSVSVNGLTGFSKTPFSIVYGASGAAINSASFAFPVTLAGGGFVTEGDFDNDGKIDLAYTNFGGNSVYISRNTSTNTTIAFTSTPIGGLVNPISAKAADLNGDGLLDLIVTNQTSGVVYVLRNTSTPGSPSFAAAQTFATGAGPRKIAASDFDGDGRIDVAVSNQSDNSVSVLRNTSTATAISFAAKIDYTGTVSPEGIAAGDLDGDGKAEIAVVSYGPSKMVSVYRNSSTAGTITFATKTDYTAEEFPWDVAIADIDGDGKADLLVSNSSPNTVSVFRNTSSPALSFAAPVSLPTASTPRGLGVGDLDADGKPDLVTANWFSNSYVCVLKNNSTAGTVAFAPYVQYTTATGPGNVVLADLNGDGLMDITSANSSSNSLSYLRNVLSILPQCPQLLSPANAATGVAYGLPLSLRWRKDAASNSYKLKLTAQSGAVVSQTLTDTVYQFTPAAGETYTWSVTPANAADPTATCADFTFSTCAAIANTLTISAAGSQKCAPDSLKIKASGTVAGMQWYLNGQPIAGATADSVWAKAEGSYAVRIVDGICFSLPSNVIAVTNLPVPPKPSLSYTGSNSICAGGSLTLNSSLTLNNQWFKDGAAIGGATGAAYSATQGGQYFVRVSTAAGCANYSDTVTLTVKPLPAVPTVTGSGSTLSAPAGYSSYQWYLNNVAVSGATAAQHSTAQNGVYKVEVSNAGGCKVFSADFNQVSTAVSEVVWSDYRIRIYPNPVQDKLTVQVSSPTAAARGLTAQVVDAHGKLLQTATLKTGTNTLHFNRLPAGIYSVVLKAGTQQNSVQVVKAN